MTQFIESSAEFSECKQFRYLLTRTWDSSLPALTFVMLNPSTADAEKLDPTITRCVGFAKREGYGGLRVINLFAYRATNPDELEIANDPIGANNHEFLEEEVQRIANQGGVIVCAWGARDFAKQEAKKFAKYAHQKNAQLAALGVTLWGAPRHPLYVKANAPLIDISYIHKLLD